MIPTSTPSDSVDLRKGNGTASAKPARFPLVTLPPRLPQRRHRPAQSNVPNDRSLRDLLREIAARHVAEERIVPPLALDELREHAEQVRKRADADLIYRDYIAIIVSNEAWRETLAQIPYNRRLLLLPKCLRCEPCCPASFDEFGLVCQGCGACPIHHLTAEAERLGYAVLVAEGSVIVTKMIETKGIEGIVGVSCLNVLEKCFPHMEATSIPGVAIPLLQDGCADTTVDLDWVWDVIHLTAEDRTYRLDLDTIKRDVQSWFTRESLGRIMGPAEGKTEEIAHDWLARSGKRWRPYLTTCVHVTLQGDACPGRFSIPPDLKKLAVAVECFHKASLIHDDIEDGDDLRYGERTMHVEHGLPVALNVGDFLLGEGYRLIGELRGDPQIRVDMLRTAADGHLTLSRGQGAELFWTRHPRPLATLEVLDIFRQKTAPAFEVALRLGAFYGGAGQDVHDVLQRYSESLGIAYQIRDDLEDYTGDGNSDDLRDLRPSLVLAIAHKRAAEGAESDLITSLWTRTCSGRAVVDEVRRIIATRGVTDLVGELQEAYKEQAIRSLRPLENPTLKGLLRRVAGKIFGGNLIEGYCSEFEARNAAGSKVSAEPAT